MIGTEPCRRPDKRRHAAAAQARKHLAYLKRRGCAVIGFTAYCTGCSWQRWFVERIDAERAAAAHAAREAGR